MGTLNSILETRFGVKADQIDDSMGPHNIAGWDSLSHLYLVADMEEEFGLEFDAEQINAMRTIGGIRAVLRSLGVER